MSVPTVITDLSETAASNSPAGSDSIGTNADNFIRALGAILREETAGDFNDVASATTCAIGAEPTNNVRITGTTTITGFGTVGAGVTRYGRFAGILTLTHNATSLILPGAANITTAANDCFRAVSLGSGNWIVTHYQAASGFLKLSGGTLTGALTAPSIAFSSTTGVVGTATNDSAASGSVGELLSGTLASGSATSLTTATAKTITSVSLTAGDWDVWGNVGFSAGGSTTITGFIVSISATNNTHATAPNGGAYSQFSATFTTGTQNVIPAGTMRVSVASTTTYYLVATANFAADAMNGWGTIQARRVR